MARIRINARSRTKGKPYMINLQRKLSKQHKKDTILYVTITFSLKQRGIRTSSGPITLPLNQLVMLKECQYP